MLLDEVSQSAFPLMAITNDEITLWILDHITGGVVYLTGRVS